MSLYDTGISFSFTGCAVLIVILACETQPTSQCPFLLQPLYPLYPPSPTSIRLTRCSLFASVQTVTGVLNSSTATLPYVDFWNNRNG